MSYVNSDALVDTAWVADHLDDPAVYIVDGSWHLPPTGRNGEDEYGEAHIPGAVYFDIDAISDPDSALPHMMPTAEAFAAAVSAMGIANDQRVVVYDSDGLFSAPRVWWMFRAMGHDNVAVMTGGFNAWKNEGRAVSAEIPAPAATKFTAQLNTNVVRSIDQVRANIDSGEELVLDARAADRFAGALPEFRPGVQPGHIPGSGNLPYAEIVDAAAGAFVSATDLRNAFDAQGATGTQPVVTTCGSGITACILGLGLHLIGRDDWAIYDGSWTEWGGRDDTPKGPEG
ncbi:MAG: 3-mercaptopyruvate sulfurtransferase [Alphaproteobacteria bacterium]|nr:3-mercaptopyruvate sulfurtransferase [Alphaproteobacteria bacterium]